MTSALEQQYDLKARITPELRQEIDRLSTELGREPYYPKLARDALVHINQLMLKRDFLARQRKK